MYIQDYHSCVLCSKVSMLSRRMFLEEKHFIHSRSNIFKHESALKQPLRMREVIEVNGVARIRDK